MHGQRGKVVCARGEGVGGRWLSHLLDALESLVQKTQQFVRLEEGGYKSVSWALWSNGGAEGLHIARVE